MSSMATNNDERWGAKSHVPDNMGLAVRPMGLKVHYTFDLDSHTNCLARWPHVLQIQVIPLDESNTIGLVNLWTCLLAIAQCSPELAGDNQRDYTVYAVDYSEPDTPLVGQGIFGWILEQGPDGAAASQMVVGRVTKNMLALFGNGIKETLEVRLKLTAVPKVGRGASTPAPQPTSETSGRRTLTRTASTMSENAEWNSFIQSNPSLGNRTTSIVSSPALAPVQPYSSNCEPRSDIVDPSFQMQRGLSGSRPPSVGPNVGRMPPVAISPLNPPLIEDQNLFSHAAKVGRAQSRPSSRASTKSTKGTGRPRGRPRKKPQPVEGSTSGYEDGTDADDGPPQRKRAKTTKVERSNTATFGSAPESLRVAASTSGSLRNFRPIAPGGDGLAGSHLQEVPRAPTPVPDYRMPGFAHQRPVAASNLRRQSTSGQDQGNSLASSYMEANRSMSQSQDARSPPNFLAPSPSQNYSDGPSPTDIGSSPPVPRSAMYSLQSSPAPSSPILPPMPAPQPDSGFMSGGFEDDRVDVDMLDKSCFEALPQPQPTTKPKTKRSRSKKKQPEKEDNLIIQSEVPGPPELLPTTSLYNPPDKAKRNTPNPSNTIERSASIPHLKRSASMISEVQTLDTEPQERQFSARFPSEASQDVSDLERAFMVGFNDNQQVRDVSMDAYTPAGETPAPTPVQPSIEQADLPMNPPPPPPVAKNYEEEPELPLPKVPASDPVLPPLTLPALTSEPAHPQTDMPGPLQGRSNKNYVRRQAIKQKLDEAIANGQMPPYCSNCGAIQTPTWRKVWKQEHTGVPAYHEYSDKPGHVTAINVLQRGDDGKPCQYEMIKKALGPGDDKNAWVEVLLCNPCGIWFSKWKALRPPEKWEKDADRLTQVRKKRSNGEPKAPRSRKPRTKSDPQPALTSEACLPTDPLGPTDAPNSPGFGRDGSGQPAKGDESTHSRAGSIHSRGSGTPGSPILLDEALGGTRRLLFPSPRKEGEQKVLGDIAVNIVQTAPEYQKLKNQESSKGKEMGHDKENKSAAAEVHADDFADLFGTPPRPSTPPPKATHSGPFKTPTRQPSNHRPITRSVSRSIRSTRSLKSPSQALMVQGTPTKTPRSAQRRDGQAGLLVAESPFTRSINQLLSEANEFVSPHRGVGFDLDFSMDSDTHLAPAGHFDFGTLLSTDAIAPSSPPVGLQHGISAHMQVAFSDSLTFDDGADLWKHLSAAGPGASFEETGEGAN